MLPIQSIEGPSHANTTVAADENGETRHQKPKTLPCKYCSKRFRRVEHVQRHERTHTKEKPFSCTWARCAKTFGRRDLLVRHEKLVHLNEGNRDGTRPRKQSSGSGQLGPSHSQADTDIMTMSQTSQPQYHPEPGVAPIVPSLSSGHQLPPARAPACNLDLLSDAATHLASANEVNSVPPGLPELSQPQTAGVGRMKHYEDIGYGDRPREQGPPALPGAYTSQASLPPLMDDYNLFLDDFTSASHFLPPSFDSDQTLGLWSRPMTSSRILSKPPSQFPSRFPSLQPDVRDPQESAARGQEDSMRAPPFRVSAVDHVVIKNKFEEFSSILPPEFVFPSRHTLSRFLEGYTTGFHDHLPFLHVPTLSPTDMAPELLLAILSVGAQYRFESHRSHALWYAAKAVATEQVRRRHSHEVTSLLPTPAAYSPHSTRPSPSAGLRHSFTSNQQDRPVTQETHRELFSSNTPQSRLETIQAFLLLFAVGIWGAKAILHEALSLQSQLASLLREEGFLTESTQTADWESWVRIEGNNRTKLIAYCFFNLCSIAYGTPPLLLTSEMNILLPCSAKLWRAESVWQWQEAKHSCPPTEITLPDAFSRLLCRSPEGPFGNVSSLGNYVLIHALIQHIYLLKQTSFVPGSFVDYRGLKPEDVEEVGQAIRIWQTVFEQHHLRSAEPNPPGPNDSLTGGPVAFNSTALLRLAHIRIYTGLGSTRTLETRDPVTIASTFLAAPSLGRSPRLNRAILQAIHALAMLVKVGVNYVARAKSLEWSIQHSLCNLECAVLLSKWLQTLANLGPNDAPIAHEERGLLEMVRRMLDETEFAVPVDPSLSGSGGEGTGPIDPGFSENNKLRQLAVAVIRLWAETFKGSHVFDLVRVIGSGLDGYADLLEKPRDRTPLGRMVPMSGLG